MPFIWNTWMKELLSEVLVDRKYNNIIPNVSDIIL